MNPKEISFVVQGNVETVYTKRCLNSIRKYFPGAEIVLSTWEHAVLEGLDYDCLVKNKDPGAVCMDKENKYPYNINRMLLSSKTGIEAAGRKYVFKCRSDLIFKGNHILKWYGKYSEREAALSVTKEKIITGSIFSLKFEQGETEPYRTPFHISDFFCFGLKEDIEKLYSVPLVDLKYFARYFEFNTKPRTYPVKGYDNRLWKYPPEQYLTLNLAKKCLPELDFPNCLDYDRVDDSLSERFTVSNFLILDYEQSGIKSQKFPYVYWSDLIFCPDRIWAGIYRHYEYLKDYKKYIDHGLQMPADRTGEKRKRYYFFHVLKNFLKPFLKTLFRCFAGE